MGKSKISIVRCEKYDPQELNAAIKKAVGAIGGIRAFVNRNDRVLIKPNILSGRKPEEAVCTHPEVVRAVIKMVKETGAVITVGDSPGGFLKNIEEVYEVSGIAKIAKEEKVNLVKFTFSRTVDGFPISIRALDADKIISIPKFKTHEITGITAGIKNMYGTVVGLNKTKCHADAPTEKKLAKIIARVYAVSKPHLSIVDAVVSMEGEGPSAGDPRNTGFIIASSDGVAIDATLAVLIGSKPHDYAVTREAARMGLGNSDMEKIDIVEGSIDEFRIKNFKHAKGRLFLRIVPGILTGAIATQLKFWPEIEADLCKKCNMCKSSCPVNAITVHKGKFQVNHSKCIRCMCCRELCPYKAISIKKSWLAKMIWE